MEPNEKETPASSIEIALREAEAGLEALRAQRKGLEGELVEARAGLTRGRGQALRGEAGARQQAAMLQAEVTVLEGMISDLGVEIDKMGSKIASGRTDLKVEQTRSRRDRLRKEYDRGISEYAAAEAKLAAMFTQTIGDFYQAGQHIVTIAAEYYQTGKSAEWKASNPTDPERLARDGKPDFGPYGAILASAIEQALAQQAREENRVRRKAVKPVTGGEDPAFNRAALAAGAETSRALSYHDRVLANL